MEKPVSSIRLYGAAWCPDCRRAKQFFGEQRIHYEYIDIEQDPSAMLLVEQINQGKRIIPTILFPDGSILVEPSNADLASKLDLQTTASRSFYDTIIIGGGPAGLTAALYLAREGIDTLVIEKAALGGQVGITEKLDNFPGFDEGISGAQFAERLGRQARRFGVEILQAQEVGEITPDPPYLCVTTQDNTSYTSKSVLLSSGARYRRLNIPGEDDLIGVNVHFCATCDGAFYKDKKVLVIGGGNSAFEESLFLTRFARQVDIVVAEPAPKASIILTRKDSRNEQYLRDPQPPGRGTARQAAPGAGHRPGQGQRRKEGLAVRWGVCLYRAVSQQRSGERQGASGPQRLCSDRSQPDEHPARAVCRRRCARRVDQTGRIRSR